jgi:hypothetical protein
VQRFPKGGYIDGNSTKLVLDYVSLDNTEENQFGTSNGRLIKFNGFRIWILPIVGCFLIREARMG